MGILNYLRKLYYGEHRILVTGLSGTGKTTLILSLANGPVYGMSFECVLYENLSLIVIDIEQIRRSLVRHFVENCQGLIVLIDSAHDIDRVRDGFQYLLENTPKITPVLIFANKQDIPGAIDYEELPNLLNLNEMIDPSRPLKILPCKTNTFNGVKEGLDFLLTTLNKW
eukprot:gene11402-13967_t